MNTDSWEAYQDELYDQVVETWSRRLRWLYACRPPWWRVIKYTRWRMLRARVYAPYDSFFDPVPYHPGRG